jgi:beta-barrel assembly-enhancing protease
MSKFLAAFLFISLSASLHSQIEEFKKNYIPLRSSGTLPEIYTRSAVEKTNADIAELEKAGGVTNRTTKERFYVNSNFSQDRLLRSGRIIFNDPISVYINKVADEVFKTDPELRKQLQIYLVKSDVVNAYCFDNGIILVNLGLVAKLENEAQLASVLSHEASHFVKKHSLESYVMKNSKKGKFTTNVDWDDYKYNHTSELEADVQGVKFFRESKYSIESIQGSFNILKHSHLPFEDLPFDKGFLEDSNLVFPPEYFLKNISEIKNEENYDDSKSSHPNIKKRKDAVAKELQDLSNDGRQKFLVSESEFYKVREIARFELCRIGLLDRDYASCIYNCYLLLKKYPSNNFLKITIGKVLFEVAAIKSPENWNYIKPSSVDLLDNSDSKNIYYDYEKKEGSSQQTYYLLNKLNAPQTTILALNYNWKLRKELNGDPTVDRLCDSLFILLALNNNKDLSYFNSITRKGFTKELKEKSAKEDSLRIAEKIKTLRVDSLNSDSMAVREKKVRSDFEKEQLKRDSLTRAKMDLYFDKYVFADFLNDTAFVRKFEAAVDTRNKVVTRVRKRKGAGDEPKQKGLGIQKIVMLDPFYLKVDQANGSIRYFASDKKLDEYSVILKENAKIAGLNFDYVDSRSLKKEDIEKYNDFVVLNDWMGEFLNHNFNANSLVLNNEGAALLKEKYKTNYMLWSGVISVKLPRQSVVPYVLASLLFYPAPFALPRIIKKDEVTYYISVLYDLENTKLHFYQMANIRMADTDDFLNSYVYDTMLNIRTEPKPKN